MTSLFDGKTVELTIEGMGRVEVRFTEASCLTQCPHCVLIGIAKYDNERCLFLCNYQMSARKGIIALQSENDDSIQTLCALYSAMMPRI